MCWKEMGLRSSCRDEAEQGRGGRQEEGGSGLRGGPW